ncbi:MAG: crossover junction endodeoxyribonuclease RuvC [Chitinophagaceae bacterium]|nr:crossover junction endodeoxyribonuclease RuvC [Chitinophagaceae bacterium]
MQKAPKIILGIDPGTLMMGYSIVIVQDGKLELVEMDILKLSAKKDNYQRLQIIHKKVSDLITIFHPDCFAIEAPFFGKNVQSMLKLGRAQGVAIAAAMSAGLEVCEYSPRKIKQSITGNGNAGKEQVWQMLQRIIFIKEKTIRYLDASDALAVAVCHHFQGDTHLKTSAKKLNGWGDFISKNPDRLKNPG